MATIRVRLTGDSTAVENLLKVIEGMEDLQHMEEVANLDDHMREDSSSAGLTDDIGGDFHDIKMHFATSAQAERARDVVEVAARSSDVVVEFLERF